MRETTITSGRPLKKTPSDWARAITYTSLCLLVFAGVAFGLQTLRIKEAKSQEAARLGQRKNELMANHVRITDDFTRPRVYAHKKLNALRNRNVQLTEPKAIVGYIDVNDRGNISLPGVTYREIRSLKILANDDLHETEQSYRLSETAVLSLIKTITSEKYKNLYSFRIRTNSRPDSDFILEGEELMALRETFELSDILKAEIARQPRPEQK